MLVEKKLLGLTEQNAVLPHVSPGNDHMYMKAFTLGVTPNLWDQNVSESQRIVGLGGFAPAPGTGASQRIGSYVYYRNTYLNGRIQMQFQNNGLPPVKFRMLLIKARRATNPAGLSHHPYFSMFLDSVGQAVGPATTGATAMSTYEYITAIVNTRDWIVYSDQKFTLSHPLRTDSDGGYAGFHGKYPVDRYFRFNLKHFKKTRCGESNHPLDVDPHYCLIIFADSIGRGTSGSLSPPASSWNIDIRGATSFQDP
jgi:hypothetical protein